MRFNLKKSRKLCSLRLFFLKKIAYLCMEEKLIETGMAISPLNASAFGALVVVLAVAVVFLWRAYDAKTKKLLEILERSVSITAKVESHMTQQHENVDTLKEIKFELTRLSDLIKSSQYKK